MMLIIFYAIIIFFHFALSKMYNMNIMLLTLSPLKLLYTLTNLFFKRFWSHTSLKLQISKNKLERGGERQKSLLRIKSIFASLVLVKLNSLTPQPSPSFSLILLKLQLLRINKTNAKLIIKETFIQNETFIKWNLFTIAKIKSSLNFVDELHDMNKW